MGLVIAGDRSGSGKTTVTLALLAGLRQQNPRAIIQSFKVGPDYIDPMFHQHITGLPCRNLDPVLTSPAYVQQCAQIHAQRADYALVEGVMGLFDGASGQDDFASTAHIARLLHWPIVLVLDCRHLSRSIAAIAHGYRTFDSRLSIVGVVLNRVGSDRHLELLTQALDSLQLPIVGVLRRDDPITIRDRHLGLVPTAELPELAGIIDRLVHLGQTCFDWTTILPWLKTSPSPHSAQEPTPNPSQEPTPNPSQEGDLTDSSLLTPHSSLLTPHSAQEPTPNPSQEGDLTSSSLLTPHSSLLTPHSAQEPTPNPSQEGDLTSSSLLTPHSSLLTPHSSLKIAIAQDAAFSFYYVDNLECLQELGAELVTWSPLQDEALPEDVSGLYLGGGFPEMFAESLSRNQRAKITVRSAIQSGLPTYAECGGLMYLCEKLVDFEGQAWPMVGILPTTVKMSDRLTLGYRCATAQQDSPLIKAGQQTWGHEFHRSIVDPMPTHPLYRLQGYQSSRPDTFEGWTNYQLHASYVHLHWGVERSLPQRFIQHCIQKYKLTNLTKIP